MLKSLLAAAEALLRLARRLPPLAAWRLAHGLAGLAEPLTRWPAGSGEAAYELLGHPVTAPIGLAAGLDKNGELAWLAAAMGMGFHVVGSVLPEPWPGVNPKILLRLPRATVNRLGLPSEGAERVARRLARLRRRLGLPVAVSIAAFTVEGYVKAYRVLEPYADWFEVNVSCPNVEEHRSFEEPDQALTVCRALRPHKKPVLIKVPPSGRERLAQYVDVVRECGAAGLVLANTLRIRLNGFEAGLGGPVLYPLVASMVRTVREIDDRMVVIAVGGVDSAAKALELIRIGADAVEVLSAVVLRGPLRVAEAARALSGLAARMVGGGRKAPRLILRGATPRSRQGGGSPGPRPVPVTARL